MGSQQRGGRRTRRQERSLVQRMLAGDERAFEELADGYFPGLYRFALRRLSGDDELTCEIVQKTVSKAVMKLENFRQEASLFTWLCACCKNEIRMHFRSLGRRPAEEVLDESVIERAPLAQAGGGPEAVAMRRESARLVHETLDRLPPRYAQALEWKYIEQLPVVEIASRLGVGDKAAESLLTRARKAFKEMHETVMEKRQRSPRAAALEGAEPKEVQTA